MPKNKFQEVIFTIIMVFFMVYAMICYNISLNIGGMSNEVFLSAFHELIIMGPIAFILDFFIVSKLAFMCAARMVDFRNCHPFSKILAISVPSVAFMCPLMSLAATILFKIRKSVHRCMDSDDSYEFPGGIFLAAHLCRTNRSFYLQTYLQRK